MPHSETGPTPATGSKSVLGYSGFRNLFWGQVISQLGDALYNIVFLWMVLEATRDPSWVGIVGACGAAPYVLFSLHSGALADRVDRRIILVASDLLSAALVGGFLLWLVVDASPPPVAIGLFAFALGTSNVIAAPARAAAIPSLVPAERLVEANSLNTSTQSAMPLVGNLLSAGLLQALFQFSKSLGYALAFGANALSFLVSAAFMARLPALQPKRNGPATSAWADAKEGVRFILRHPFLRPAMIVSLLINLAVAPFMPAYVVVAQQRYQGNPALLAWLEAGFFIGMLIGSVLAGRVRVRRPGPAFSGWLAAAGLLVVPMGYADSPGVFWLLNLLCGITIPLAAIPLTTLIQVVTPDELRGRVNASLGMMAALMTPVGMAASGALLAAIGIEGTFIAMAAGFSVPPLVALASRAYRETELPTATAPETAASECIMPESPGPIEKTEPFPERAPC